MGTTPREERRLRRSLGAVDQSNRTRTGKAKSPALGEGCGGAGPVPEGRCTHAGKVKEAPERKLGGGEQSGIGLGRP